MESQQSPPPPRSPSPLYMEDRAVHNNLQITCYHLVINICTAIFFLKLENLRIVLLLS